MFDLLIFGTIFTFLDKQYVFLAMEGGTVYAARILDRRETALMVSARNSSVKNRGESSTRALPVFCFVELSTEGYESQAAHLNQTDAQKELGRFLFGVNDKLNKQDMVELHREIMEGPVPLILKRRIAEIDLENVAD
jgi:hypothetical protein